MDRRKSIRRGFSLVEAAIVLAVVGLVVAGIWVAASAVSERMKINQTATGILKIVTDMRHLFGRESYPQSPTNTWITDTVIKAETLPANWYSSDSGDAFITPLGISSNVLLSYDNVELSQSGNNGIIFLFYSGLTDSQCIKLVMEVGSHFRNQSDLVYIAIGSASYMRSFPPVLSTVTSNCEGRGGNPGVLFVFSP